MIVINTKQKDEAKSPVDRATASYFEQSKRVPELCFTIPGSEEVASAEAILRELKSKVDQT